MSSPIQPADKFYSDLVRPTKVNSPHSQKFTSSYTKAEDDPGYAKDELMEIILNSSPEDAAEILSGVLANDYNTVLGAMNDSHAIDAGPVLNAMMQDYEVKDQFAIDVILKRPGTPKAAVDSATTILGFLPDGVVNRVLDEALGIRGDSKAVDRAESIETEWIKRGGVRT